MEKQAKHTSNMFLFGGNLVFVGSFLQMLENCPIEGHSLGTDSWHRHSTGIEGGTDCSRTASIDSTSSS